MITKIISGGQTGADRGGLEAARELGIPTGGYAPKGYLTENGPDLSLRKFGLREGISSSYPARTLLNILESDGTVIFGNVNSSGSRLTKRQCEAAHQPILCNPTLDEFKYWIEQYQIEVLNVAGNRESVNPGIGQRVKNFLTEALSND